MQLLSSTASRLRQAVARGWRALADVHRNQVHVRERYYRHYRPQREWAVARSHDSGMPAAAGAKGGARHEAILARGGWRPWHGRVHCHYGLGGS